MMSFSTRKIWICVDVWGDGALKGRVCLPIIRQEMGFSDINELFAQLERLFDAIKFPAASTQYRIFGHMKQAKKEKREVRPVAQNIAKKMLEETPVGKKATFVVQVMYRQNATWQGQVVWSEKNETKQFRSALELIKLIDSATEKSNI